MKRLLYNLYRLFKKNKVTYFLMHHAKRLLGLILPGVANSMDRAVLDEKYYDEMVALNLSGDGPLVDQIENIDIMSGEKSPFVTVIVPNYNHEKFLKKRLDSIYNQTYQNFEVILLDDCSTDHSRMILKAFAEKYPEKTRCVFNRENSGGVFRQWRRGFSMARGKYIWIAESDDWCDENFLETLVPLMEHESVMIAFAKSIFMKDNRQVWSIEHYLHDLNFNWDGPFIMTGHMAMMNGFAVKNIIPNVSSALIRNVGEIPAEITDRWEHLKLCGDWLFYAFLIRGGCIAYTNQTLNYYRQHDHNTNTSVQDSARYYQETFEISCYIAENYRLDIGSFEQTLETLRQHYIRHHGGGDGRGAEQWYSLEEIRRCQAHRKKNILMCNYAMSVGGGEIFPVYLANALRKAGQNVTFLDCNMGEYSPLVRDKLDPSVPFVRLVTPLAIRSAALLLGIDIVHSHHGNVDKLVSEYLSGYDLAQVITLHGMYEAIDPKDLKGLLAAVSKTCAKFIYIADKNLLPFKEAGLYREDRFVRIGNGLFPEPVEPVDRASLNIPEDAFVMCLVSRAKYEKGWLEACRIAQGANQAGGRPVHLVLVGGGEALPRVQELAEKDPHIHPVGEQGNPRAYYAMSDVGILPTWFAGESFPLTVIECMMCGRPVLASNVGEIAHQLTYDDDRGEVAGYLIDLKDDRIDLEAWTGAVTEIAGDPGLYGELKEIAEKNWKRFDIAETAGKYIAEYNALPYDTCAH